MMNSSRLPLFLLVLVFALRLGCAPTAARAQALSADDLDAITTASQPIYPELEAIYKDLHQNPELSMQEKRTAGKVAEELRKTGFQVTEGVGETGVVGVFANGTGPTVLLRADMDGLPIKEMTGLPYASQVEFVDESGFKTGVMHACGHDVHMTCLLGAARTLIALKDRWAGTLVVIMQPGEERGAGARLMLADGLYTKFPRPDYAMALHVDSSIEAGAVGYTSGYAMANVDSVDIIVRGVGGHGAYPETTRDPVLIAAQMIVAFQSIVSREISALEPAVITVGSIHGGSKHNIIPNEVKLQLTIRSYSDEVRKRLLDAIARVANGVAQAMGVPESLAPIIDVRDEYTPATWNDPELTRRQKKVFEALLGADKVHKREPMMGGEDFGRYGREEPRVPILLFRLGSVTKEAIETPDPKTGMRPSLHTAFYKPETEPTIRTGVKAMTAAALELLKPPPAPEPTPAPTPQPEQPKMEEKPSEGKPMEAKPAEGAPAEAKPAEAAPMEPKPDAPKPEEPKPEEPKPEGPKPDAPKPEEAKPEEPPPAEPKPEETKPAEAK